jgi:hypothetical protein
MNTTPECKETERFTYLTDDELTREEAAQLAGHLESCNECRKKRSDFLSLRKHIIQTLNRSIPVSETGLSTERILQSIHSHDQPKSLTFLRLTESKLFRILRYSTSIAALFLLFLFVSEQADSVRKISKLEARIETAIPVRSPGLIDRITLTRSLFTIGEWNEFSNILRVNHGIIDSFELLRIKILLEKKFGTDNLWKLKQYAGLPDLFKNITDVKTIKTLIK